MNRTIKYLQSAGRTDQIEIPQLVHEMLSDAISAGASDIHIEAWDETIAVRIRVNGVLTELAHLPLELMERVSARLKVMANLVTYRVDLPQDGRMDVSDQLGGVEMRISVFPNVRGEKIVIRIFDPTTRRFDLEHLGFDEGAKNRFETLLARPSGMILMTGPTGSGKTTAIYSALGHIVQRHGPAASISTIEDPVEFSLPMISQTQINPAREFSYAIGLRSLLRQDPQVIMVGEIRDPDTASIALQAGLTGHLVISTIHSDSSPGVFARLINMELEPFLLASSIIAVMSLRLIRRNCPLCATPYEPHHPLLAFIPAAEMEIAEFRRGSGCAECFGTGFSQRVPIVEMMIMNDVLCDSILSKTPTSMLRRVAVQEGMQTLGQSALQKAVRGETTLEEVSRVIGPAQM